MEVVEKHKLMGMFKFFPCENGAIAAVPLNRIRTCESFEADPSTRAHWEIDGESPHCSNCGVNPEDFFHTAGYDCVCMNHDNPPKRCPNCGAVMEPYER